MQDTVTQELQCIARHSDTVTQELQCIARHSDWQRGFICSSQLNFVFGGLHVNLMAVENPDKKGWSVPIILTRAISVDLTKEISIHTENRLVIVTKKIVRLYQTS